MDYFRIELSPSEDKGLCVLPDGPEGTQPIRWAMSHGESVAAEYPKGARWTMTPKYPGLKLATLLANTGNLLVVHRDLKDAIAKLGVPVESYGFDLHDHKKRLASRDYFIVNPLGTYDALDPKASRITWSSRVPGEVVQVDEPVLDPKKLVDAPPLFRVKEDPLLILLSEAAVDALSELDPTNVYLEPVRKAA